MNRTFAFAVLTVALCVASPAETATAQVSAANPDGVFLEQAADRPIGSDDTVSQTDANSTLSDILENPGLPSVQRYVHQFLLGSGNLSFTIQDGEANSANISQFGLSNLAVLSQHGSGNAVSFVQEGTQNVVGVRLDGDNNLLDVRQTGSRNVYVLDFEGSDLQWSGDHAVEQIGDNNHLIQVGRGRLPFSVQQRGNGMKMVVRHR